MTRLPSMLPFPAVLITMCTACVTTQIGPMATHVKVETERVSVRSNVKVVVEEIQRRPSPCSV